MNLHNQLADGLLWSGEDQYDKARSNVTLGLGSTAMAQLIRDNEPVTTMYAAVRKLTWGFEDQGYLPQLAASQGAQSATYGAAGYAVGFGSVTLEANKKYLATTEASPGESEGAPPFEFSNSCGGYYTKNPTCTVPTTQAVNYTVWSWSNGSRWNYRVSEIAEAAPGVTKTVTLPVAAAHRYTVAPIGKTGACPGTTTTMSGACACSGGELGCACTTSAPGLATMTVTRPATCGAIDYGVVGGTGAAGPDAWEVVMWGPKTYTTFLLMVPRDATWPAVAGFVKAIWRWNAPPTMTLKLGQISGGQPVQTHVGMMGAYSRVLAGTMTPKVYAAGMLAFMTATINNVSVAVDFAAWAGDTSPTMLGNVSGTPTSFEGAYGVYERDGLMYVYFNPINTSTVADLGDDPGDLRDINGSCITVPVRCAGFKARGANNARTVGVPLGKCDRFVQWGAEDDALQFSGGESWTASPAVTTKVAKYNDYMKVSKVMSPLVVFPSNAPTSTGYAVLSETYVHLNQAATTVTCPGGVQNLAPNSSFETAGTLGAGSNVLEKKSGHIDANANSIYGPFAVKAGTVLTASLTGWGEADLYVRFNGLPSVTAYDCRPMLPGTTELCSVTVPTTASSAYVMVNGVGAADYVLRVEYTTTKGAAVGTLIPVPVAGAKYQLSNEGSLSGRRMLKITNTGANVARVTTSPTGVPVAVGARYTASVWRAGWGLDCDTATPTGVSRPGKLRLNFLSSTGVLLGFADSPVLYPEPDANNLYGPCADQIAQWRSVAVAGTAPVGSAFAQAEFWVDGQGIVAVDNLEIARTDGLAGLWRFDEGNFLMNKALADSSGSDSKALTEGSASTINVARSYVASLPDGLGDIRVPPTRDLRGVVSATVGLNQQVNTNALSVVPGTTVVVTMTPTTSTADADLYVRFGAIPTTAAYACRPYLGAGLAETCTLTVPAGQSVMYASVVGYTAATVSIDVSWVAPNSSLNLAGPFTIGGWVDFWSAATPTQWVMRKQSAGSASALAWGIGTNASGQLVLSATIGGILRQTPGASTAALTPGIFHHIAGVYTGTALQLYVDAVLVAQVAVTGAVAINGDDLRMGDGFKGRMDSMMAYSRALSLAELQALAATNPDAPVQ